ncbi:MAG: ParB/RepB/Spo0J family partition protein [Peptococcaceae bacterium]|nr:ParB/RepB/Spo0J family partition protein [Peptococcaceae bacterium]
MSKKGLGKGLQALLPSADAKDEIINEIALDQIVTNPNQPRKNFDLVKLEELAESIKLHGVVQPIIVRARSRHKYEVVAGERRFRACLLAGLSTIPVVIKDYSDAQVAEIALIENIQRQDLDPIEEAAAYRTLIDEFKFTQETLAKQLGKSRPFIANSLRLLSLPSQVQRYLTEGSLTVGHAKVILALNEPSLIMLVAQKVARSGLSVRETETLVKGILDKTDHPDLSTADLTPEKEKSTVDPIVGQIEDRLRSLLRTQVKIKTNGDRGRIVIDYYGQEELSQIVEVLLGELS